MVNSERSIILCAFIKYRMDIRSQERIFFQLHTNNITDNNYSRSKPPFRLCVPCPSPSPLAPPCQSSSVSPAPSPSPPEMAPPSMLTKSGPPPHQTDVSRSLRRLAAAPSGPPAAAPVFYTFSLVAASGWEGSRKGDTEEEERERKKEEGAPLISTLREIITDFSDVCFGSAWTIAETAEADSYLSVSLRGHTWARGGEEEGIQFPPDSSQKSASPGYSFLFCYLSPTHD